MTADLTAEIAAASAGTGGGSKTATPRAAVKPAGQKRPKDKNGKRRQERGGGAEEVA